jgi:hypothetical protein
MTSYCHTWFLPSRGTLRQKGDSWGLQLWGKEPRPRTAPRTQKALMLEPSLVAPDWPWPGYQSTEEYWYEHGLLPVKVRPQP